MMYFYRQIEIIALALTFISLTWMGCYPPPEQPPQVPTTNDEEDTSAESSETDNTVVLIGDPDDQTGQNPLICGMSVEIHFDGNYIRYKNYSDEYLYTAVVDDESGTLLSSDYAWPAGNEFGWDTDIDEVDVLFSHGKEITVSVERLIIATDLYELCRQASFILP